MLGPYPLGGLPEGGRQSCCPALADWIILLTARVWMSPSELTPAGLVELHQVVCRFRHLLDLGRVPQLSELAEAIAHPKADGSDPFNTLMVRPTSIILIIVPHQASCHVCSGAYGAPSTTP